MTVAVPDAGTVAGAVNRPVVDTVPAVVVQLTAVFEVPETVAARVSVAPVTTVATCGLTATLTGTVTVMIELPIAAGLTTLVAVIVKLCDISRLAGAV